MRSARRRHQSEMAGGDQRGFERTRLSAGRPMPRAISDQRLRRHALLLPRDRHRDDAPRQAGEIPAGSRRCPWSSACRGRSPAGAARASSRSPSAAAMARPPSALWPPSSQSSLPAGTSCLQRALRQVLHARRPFGLGEARFESLHRQRQSARRAAWRSRCRHCRADGGREASAAADRAGRRRPDRPAGRAPRARATARRRCAAARAGRAPPARSRQGQPRGCGAIAAGTPRLRMPAFSAAIFSMVSPRNSR